MYRASLNQEKILPPVLVFQPLPLLLIPQHRLPGRNPRPILSWNSSNRNPQRSRRGTRRLRPKQNVSSAYLRSLSIKCQSSNFFVLFRFLLIYICYCRCVKTCVIAHPKSQTSFPNIIGITYYLHTCKTNNSQHALQMFYLEQIYKQ